MVHRIDKIYVTNNETLPEISTVTFAQIEDHYLVFFLILYNNQVSLFAEDKEHASTIHINFYANKDLLPASA
jgi:hypothetical protein